LPTDRANSEKTGGTPLGDEGGSVPFGPLREERSRIDRIVNRLEVTEDLTERADLAGELVRSVSRYEDTLERAVFPRMGESSQDGFKELDQDRELLRDLMTVIHESTTGIDPRNVHASDPEGFEKVLDDVAQKLQELLANEDRQVTALLATLGPEERREMEEDVAHAFGSASERPHPPKTTAGRFLSNTRVKLDHTFEDVSSPQHPGADTING
jgi:Hemerythrin HHE cation binding domain